MSEAKFSLADFDEASKSDIPARLNFPNADGTPSPLFLHILGDQSPRVVKEQDELTNERRKHQQLAASQPGASDFRPVESDRDFIQRLAAIRIADWDGIDTPYSKEGALQLIKTNRRAADFVSTEAARIGNFTKASSET